MTKGAADSEVFYTPHIGKRKYFFQKAVFIFNSAAGERKRHREAD